MPGLWARRPASPVPQPYCFQMVVKKNVEVSANIRLYIDDESRSWHVSTFLMTWDQHGAAWLPSPVKLEFHLHTHSML